MFPCHRCSQGTDTRYGEYTELQRGGLFLQRCPIARQLTVISQQANKHPSF